MIGERGADGGLLCETESLLLQRLSLRLSKNYSLVIARPRRGRGNLAELFRFLYVFRRIRNFSD